MEELNLEEKSKNSVQFKGERKQITVAFCDLSGYSRLSEKLDPEDVKGIMNRIFGAIVPVVDKFDGYIDKFIGDAVMIIFGFPKAHEDDPSRAIRAAIAIHDLVDELSRELQPRIDHKLSMHTGITTGLVVTGEIELVKGRLQLTGDTVNLAARLTDVARTGEIVVGKETQLLAERYFNFEALEPAMIKGKSEPVQAYKMLSIKETPATVRRLSGLRSKLVGREKELAQLQEAIAGLHQGESRMIAISGEPGTGKSRLIEELKTSLDLDSVQWREGLTYAYAQNIPYFILINLLSRAWQIEEGDPPEIVRQKVEINIGRLLGDNNEIAPYIGGLYSLSYPEVEEVSPEFRKSRIFEAIGAVLGALTRKAPAVIYLEDLHWADSSSIELLRSLFIKGKYPVLFICAWRPPFTLFNGDQISDLGGSYQEIELRELSSSEAMDMMESLLKTSDIPSQLRQFSRDKAEGNPFYLEEVVNSLIETETLVSDDEGWRLTEPLIEVNIPPTIKGIIAARLDHLEIESKRVLQEASVVGRVFLNEILMRISELKDQLDECLDNLQSHDLIRELSVQPELEYIFKHALTQDVAYSGLLKEERQNLHERIGLVIEALFPDRLSEFYETLAFHFKKSRSLEKAVHYLIKSAEKSLESYAVEESHRYFREAYEMLSQEPARSEAEKERLIDLLCKWSLTLDYLGAFAELQDLLDRHKTLADTLKDKDKLTLFYSWLALASWNRDQNRQAYDYAMRALESEKEITDQTGTGYAHMWAALSCADLGQVDEALVHAERGKEIAADKESDHFMQYMALTTFGYAHWAAGNRNQTYQVAQALFEMGHAHSSIRAQVTGHWVMGQYHVIDKELSAAKESFQQARDIAMDPWMLQYPKLFLGLCNIYDGEYDEAEKPLREVIAFSEAGADVIGRSAYCLLGVVLAAKGQLKRGVKMVGEAQQFWWDNECKWRYVISENILGELYLQIVEGGSSPSFFTIIKNLGFIIRNVPFAAKKAEHHFRQAINTAEQAGYKKILGDAYLGLGRLYKIKGNRTKAEECFSKAIDCFTRGEAMNYAAYAENELISLGQGSLKQEQP